jgi:hypothetical protein
MAIITADGHPDLQLTALAAIAEAVLAVADEVAGLRELLTVKPSPGPGTPSVPSPERGGPSVPFGVIGELPWSPGGRPPEGWGTELSDGDVTPPGGDDDDDARPHLGPAP